MPGSLIGKPIGSIIRGGSIAESATLLAPGVVRFVFPGVVTLGSDVADPAFLVQGGGSYESFFVLNLRPDLPTAGKTTVDVAFANAG